MLVTKDEYEIDDDQARLDLDVVHGFVTGSYWAEGVSRDVVERSVANSLTLGLYHRECQVGFTRAVTDRATFAWVCDVFVLPAHRGRRLGHWMIETLCAHPDMARIRRIMLATADAHQVYADCGFTPLSDPSRYMEISRPPRELYQHLLLSHAGYHIRAHRGLGGLGGVGAALGCKCVRSRGVHRGQRGMAWSLGC